MTATVASTRESENPYLSGNFAPVQREITATELEVTGKIPEHLDGRYLRIGPNPMSDPDPRGFHWFLGEGMAHGLRLRDGTAQWYRNRWVRSAAVARALGERWPGGPYQGGFDLAANTNIIGHAGRTLALVEAGSRPYELTDELETIGGWDFCGTLFGGYSGHPKRDPATGELHAVSYNPLRGNIVQYTVAGIDGKVRRTVDIRLKAQTMMHDFSLTENYVVLYDLPVALDFGVSLRNAPARAAARMVSRFAARHAAPDFLLRAALRASAWDASPDLGLPYRWAPERRARVGVLPREGTAADIRWFEVQPCYVFHPLNAYDDGRRIVLDVVRHASVFNSGSVITPPGSQSLDRWTADLATGRVHEQRLDDTAQEFPRVDERLVGRRHRFGYAVGLALGAQGTQVSDAILKHDAVTGSTRVVRFGEGREPGEFVFVPSAPDAAEDDGVAMGFVYDRTTDRSDLVLLDAQTLETVAMVHLPARVPHGFHGNWVPSEG
ncbi:carotenoid oxygenase family protein [Nocardia nepalensis]|uniref:carotenoid oxygenase family protein n=1 Tax=Nocardia nepalensis TaxID=3375448 RepID=UPI003B67C41A